MLMFALGVALTWATLAYSSLIFDNSPAVVVHKQILKTPSVNGNGRLTYLAIYDKRPHCDVTSGAYQIRGVGNGGASISLTNIQPRTYGTWEVGRDKEKITTVVIPKELPPGKYELRWSYTYNCAGTFRDQTITSPWMAFERISRLQEMQELSQGPSSQHTTR